MTAAQIPAKGNTPGPAAFTIGDHDFLLHR